MAAALWSLIGVFATYARRGGIGALEVSFWRAALAGLAFVVLACRSGPPRIAARDIAMIAVFGIIGVAVFNAALVASIAEGGLSLAFMLLYSAPAFVIVFARPLLGERITHAKVVLVLLIAVGITLVGSASGGGVRVSARSVSLGLLSGAAYSSFYVIGKPLFARYPPTTVFAYAMPIGALCLLPFVHFRSKSGGTWGWLATLALLSTVGAYTLYGLGIRRIEASRAVLVATIEPVLALAWGALIFSERFGWRGWLGSAFVVGASLGAVFTPADPAGTADPANTADPADPADAANAAAGGDG